MKPRFVGRTIPVVLAAFALAFAGVLVVDLYIEHRQIEASTHVAESTISLLSIASDFGQSLERFNDTAARGTPDAHVSSTLQANQARLDAAMRDFEDHLGGGERPTWRQLLERIDAISGDAPRGAGLPAAERERLVSGVQEDLSQVVTMVDRRGLAALANAQRLHVLEGTLEAGVLLFLAASSAALLFGWRRQEALARSRDAAIEENLRRTLEQLDGFAGRVAHDLRNPLTPILAGSQWIEHAPVADAVRAQAERIERAGRRLGRMIDALLQYTRATSGSAPTSARTPVNEAVEEVVADFSELARSRGASLETDLGSRVTIACEAERIQSIVANLVDNALKYATAEDVATRIIVRTRLQPPFCVLEVEDNGPGIPPELRERVFEPLFRGQTGGSGIGLGLSIVQRLVAAQHGRIELLSGEQGGARFRILLPIDPASRDETEPMIAGPAPV